MPRSRNRSSRSEDRGPIIVMPTLRLVKISVPALFSQHSSAASTKHQKPHSKAHIFIRRIFGQISVIRLRKNVIPEFNPAAITYRSKGPERLTEGMHTRPDEMRVTPNRVRTTEGHLWLNAHPTKLHPKVVIAGKPMLKSKRTKLYQLKVA